MSYGLQVVTAAARDPIDLGVLKQHLRIDTADEDALLCGLIKAATEAVELATHRSLITRTLRLSLGEFPPFVLLPRAPLSSVTSVTYLDSAGATQALTPGTDYQVIPTEQPGRICPAYGKSWPSGRKQPEAVQVTYVAGYGPGPDAVPQLLRQAILLLCGAWFEHREEQTAAVVRQIPVGAQRILDLFTIGDEFTEYGNGEE